MASPPPPTSPPVPPYSRDTLVHCLTRFYTTLSDMGYIRPSSILYPPPSGWSDTRISANILTLTGRNETVIDLVKHLPYLTKEYQVWPETEHLSYLDRVWDDPATVVDRISQGGGLANIYPFMPFETALPGMICLTHGSAGVWWLIDTEAGLMWPNGSHWDVHAGPEDPPWMWYVPVGIEAFFDKVQKQLEELEVVPMPGFARARKSGVMENVEHHVFWAGEMEGKPVKKIFVECGWPDLEKFRKEECIERAGDERLRVAERWAFTWYESDIKTAEKNGDAEDKERCERRLSKARREYALEWEE
ncbi:hypothetical protein VE03_08746 [Pseudogymnoascus sp. 23342-1-I1]|nr:hypothetical protein VE03_08746 [Pseudogymnoascus sp. 23342-1-I1]